MVRVWCCSLLRPRAAAIFRPEGAGQEVVAACAAPGRNLMRAMLAAIEDCLHLLLLLLLLLLLIHNTNYLIRNLFFKYMIRSTKNKTLPRLLTVVPRLLRDWLSD